MEWKDLKEWAYTVLVFVVALGVAAYTKVTFSVPYVPDWFVGTATGLAVVPLAVVVALKSIGGLLRHLYDLVETHVKGK